MMATSYESELERAGRITITIKGVSMRPLFHADSDAIIIKKCAAEALKNLDIVLFKRPGPNGMQYVLHRIVGRREDGNYIIAGDNCTSADIVPLADILGIVVSAQRGSKPIPLQGIKYGVYEKFWCAPYKMRFKVLRVKNKARSAAKKIISLGRK
ncbi:S24/S26 family peptidase [uncultured Ruminococcus sp.]|uniref:S24/S26 family peptidase n=1 Tax=uncultured Ruminococcus sp. TaxID=165186 RepID=UPI0026174B04|nr:S24/S26 family peptidase [uncultured Ruminococcus sp.]